MPWLLTPSSHGVKSGFGSLKFLELEGVQINDEMVYCFLASCMNLESLTLAVCPIKNIRFDDPLSKLKFLNIYYCNTLESLEISVVSLVSYTFHGDNVVDMTLKNVPNLSEVDIGGRFCESFLFEADKHSYSSQLERLTLFHPHPYLMHESHYYPLDLPQYESLNRLHIIVQAMSEFGQSLLFYTILIKACPLLNEFEITVLYTLSSVRHHMVDPSKLFPNVSQAEAPIFHHENLKLVALCGYIGCESQDDFLMQILKIAPSLKRMTVGTTFHDPKDVLGSEFPQYTYAKSRSEAKRFAEQLRSKIPSEIHLLIL